MRHFGPWSCPAPRPSLLHFAAGILPLLLLLPPLVQAQPDEIRVRLFGLQAPNSVTVQGLDGEVQLFAADQDVPIARLPAEAAVEITLRNGDVYAALPEGGVYARGFRLEPDRQLTLDVSQGRPLDAPRTYGGALHISPDPDQRSALRLINHVALETYVASVLPREYGFDDLEGAKAMAVVIRTYALGTLGKYGDAYDHEDHVGSQVFDGLGKQTPHAARAARETRGQVLTHDGALIEAVYFASSGGHTADNEAVWQSRPLPYLRGKPDPYDRSPHRAWRSEIAREPLLRLLSQTYSGTVTGFVPVEKSREGRVQWIDLLKEDGSRQRIRANAFRLLLNRQFGAEGLRSTFFEASRRGDQYVFEGKGYGHGVGLCQWGAHEMARQGKSYQEILHYYYTGVQLETLDAASAGPPLVTRPEPATAPPTRTASAPATEKRTPASLERPAAPPTVDKAGDEMKPPRRIGW